MGTNYDTTYKTNHLDASLLEFFLLLGKCSQFRRADRSEISRVREENGPAVADPLMEVNFAESGLGPEVGGYKQAQSATIEICTFPSEEDLPIDPRRRRGCSGAFVARNRRRDGCGIETLEAKATRDNGAALGAALRARKPVRERIDAMLEVVVIITCRLSTNLSPYRTMRLEERRRN